MKPCFEDVLEKIIDICREERVERAVLFGSRAKHTDVERSDIDIAVEGVPDYDRLRERIGDIPTLLSIDLIEYERLRDKEIINDIREYGREIYKKA